MNLERNTHRCDVALFYTDVDYTELHTINHIQPNEENEILCIRCSNTNKIPWIRSLGTNKIRYTTNGDPICFRHLLR